MRDGFLEHIEFRVLFSNVAIVRTIPKSRQPMVFNFIYFSLPYTVVNPLAHFAHISLYGLSLLEKKETAL
jgi:hypothetical protein